MGNFLANHADRADQGHHRSRSRRRQARVRGDDDDEENRCRRDRSGAAGMKFLIGSRAASLELNQRRKSSPRRTAPPATLLETDMKTILSVALILSLCGLARAADDKAADPVGTWKIEYTIG